VEKDQFSGHPTENPHIHLCDFLAKCDTIKLNEVFADTIRLWLFPFSLMDRASEWLLNEQLNSFTTWEALSIAFLSKYFPPGKTAKLRSPPSLNETMSRFIRRGKYSKIFNTNAPSHGVPNWLLIQTSYNGLDQPLKMSVDAVADGVLMGKSIETAKALLEEMASNNYH